MSALSSLGTIVQALSVLFFYGMMGLVVVMLYRVSKDVTDLKRTMMDLQESVALAQLPSVAKPEERP